MNSPQTKWFGFLFAFVLLTQNAPVANTLAADTSSQPPETQPVLLQMLRDDSVHSDLNLTSAQIDAVVQLLREVDGPWFRVRIRPAEERIATIGQLTSQVQSKLESVLDADQLTRLDQLQNQALGTRMVVRPKTAKALGLDQSDLASLYDQFRETDRAAADIQSRMQSGELDGSEAGKEMAKLKESEKKAVVGSLSNEQKRNISTLTGKPFDFSAVKRTYPAAPELTDAGSSWLQGDALKLEDLRGKVVAIHFYAFQCINCRRNLPHYNLWHTDYADDGLVVIGIQTPETSAERSPDRVAAAIKSESIEYPVLMDAESANWKTWSNTMWPTVYLIDKKGYLRRWWQGEMNWKGTPGEQQMRQTIEQLLAED